VLGPLARSTASLIDRFLGMSPAMRVATQIVDRPHYAYCMLGAARLAKALGHDRVSAVEIGVAGGNGLVFMVDFAEQVRRATGVTVECYGFDTGTGMPEPEGPADLPYWFEAQQYPMDVDTLRRRIGDAELILGNVKKTILDFLAKHDPAPIGAIFNDTDYYSSTRDSFLLFDKAEESPKNSLPRLFLCFDDIIGTEVEMYCDANGQLRAIKEFNEENDRMKIALNQNLLPQYHSRWRHQIYYAHLFSHPQYETYLDDPRQEALHEALKLRPSQ
jgi:hypothetical protein